MLMSKPKAVIAVVLILGLMETGANALTYRTAAAQGDKTPIAEELVKTPKKPEKERDKEGTERLGTAAVPRLIEQLDSPTFSEREAASRDLRRIGVLALAALRKAARGNSSLEVRRRAEHLIRVIQDDTLERALKGAEWHLLGKTDLEVIHVEKALYELRKGGEPQFYVRVLVTNVTERPVGVDLRGNQQWEAIYPALWTASEKDRRNAIREMRIVHGGFDKTAFAKLRADFAAARVTIIPPGKSVDYYRTNRMPIGEPADMKGMKGKYFILSLDGEQRLTDGRTAEQFSLEWDKKRGLDSSRTDLVIPAPVPWRTIPADGRIVGVRARREARRDDDSRRAFLFSQPRRRDRPHGLAPGTPRAPRAAPRPRPVCGCPG
jgi:hypothetical protein